MSEVDVKKQVAVLEETIASEGVGNIERYEALLSLKSLLMGTGMKRDTFSEYIQSKFGVSEAQIRRFQNLVDLGITDIIEKFDNCECSLGEALRMTQAGRLIKCTICEEIKKGDKFGFNRTTCLICERKIRPEKGTKKQKKESNNNISNVVKKTSKKAKGPAALRMDTPRVFSQCETVEHLIQDMSFQIHRHGEMIKEAFPTLSHQEKVEAFSMMAREWARILVTLINDLFLIKEERT